MSLLQNTAAASDTTQSLFNVALGLAGLTAWGRENILQKPDATAGQLTAEQQIRSGVTATDPAGAVKQSDRVAASVAGGATGFTAGLAGVPPSVLYLIVGLLVVWLIVRLKG